MTQSPGLQDRLRAQNSLLYTRPRMAKNRTASTQRSLAGVVRGRALAPLPLLSPSGGQRCHLSPCGAICWDKVTA